MIEINKNPTKKELAWFGALALLFFGILGLSLLHKTHSLHLAMAIWCIAATMVVVYYAIPPLRKPVYVGWLYATYPIGWAISHILLAVAFFGVFSPVGLLMRLMGRDPLARQFDRSASSYWEPHDPGTDQDRYFRQY
jgi:hypothetical protein